MQIIITEAADYKIDHLIEEMKLFDKMNDKIQEYFDKIEKKLSTKGEIGRAVKAEKEAKKRREDYLKKNNIDLSEIKKNLKAGKSIKVPLKQIFDEIIADSKNIGGPETAKLSMGIVLVIIIQAIVHFSLLPLGLSAVAASLIGGSIVAPITEEIFKKLTIRKNQSFMGYALFNLVETAGAMNAGVPFAVRIPSMITHAVYTMIHISGKIKDQYSKDLDIKVDENKFKNQANKIATALHGLKNASATYHVFYT